MLPVQAVTLDPHLTRACRVLSEDADSLVIEVPKDPDKARVIREGDKFWTLVFVKPHGGDSAVPWLPWET